MKIRTFKIDKNFIENNQLIVNDKMNEWRKYFPKLKFDKYGRAEIGAISSSLDLHLDTLYEEFEDCSSIFKECIEKVLKNQFDMHSHYHVSLYDIFYAVKKQEELYEFKNSRYNYKKVKVSKILSAAQLEWEERTPRYNEIKKEIKEIRSDSSRGEVAELNLQRLIAEKIKLEKNNIYISYQRFSNEIKKDTVLYLTVNPLDFLCSASCGDNLNPTNFSTCWRLKWEHDENNDLILSERGEYGSPYNVYNISCLLNRAMIFIKNGKNLSVKDTDFEFIGYAERGQIMFETLEDNVTKCWFERVYPSKNELRENSMKNILKENCDMDFLSISDISFNNDVYIMNYQDKDGVERYLDKRVEILNSIKDSDYLKEVYLDTTAINENMEMCILAEKRVYSDCDFKFYDFTEQVYQCTCGKMKYLPSNKCWDDIRKKGFYLCEDCLKEYIVKCPVCGEFHDKDYCTSVTLLDGSETLVCNYCLDSKFVKCDVCQCYHRSDLDDSRMHECVNGYVCDNCLEENTVKCDKCGKLEILSEIKQITIDGNCTTLCGDCYFFNVSVCDKCGCLTLNNDSLCNSCAKSSLNLNVLSILSLDSTGIGV